MTSPRSDITFIGRIRFRNDNRLFGIEQEDRFSHLYIVGKTGTGKSTLLEYMARQDLERGRPMEIDALVGAVQELGRLTDTPTPTLDTVLALVALRGRVAGLYH